MPAQQTDLLFKANETATLTTSGTLEKQGGIFPLCKAEAPSMSFAQTYAAHQLQEEMTTSRFYKDCMLLLCDHHAIESM